MFMTFNTSFVEVPERYRSKMARSVFVNLLRLLIFISTLISEETVSADKSDIDGTDSSMGESVLT